MNALHHLATPEEIAPAVLFFASDLSRVITGQTLDVNCGRTMTDDLGDSRPGGRETERMLLKDKRCIVSGVGPGLGKEIALAFAREGADVALGARTESYLEEVHGRDRGDGPAGRARAAPTSPTRSSATRLVAAASTGSGGSTCSCTTRSRPTSSSSFEDVDLAAWRHIMDVNLFGSLQLTKSVIPHMKAQGSGLDRVRELDDHPQGAPATRAGTRRRRAR